MTISDAPIHTLQGEPTSLAAFDGKTILAVNVASKCGLTPQYTGLEELQKTYGDQRVHRHRVPVQPVPRPGAGHRRGDRDVLLHHLRRHVPADGEDRRQRRRSSPASTPSSPQVADAEGHSGDIRWNFEKFLIAPDGTITRFSPMTTPDDPALVAAIEASL